MECCADYYSPYLCADWMQSCSRQTSEQYKLSVPEWDRDWINQTCNAYCSNASPQPNWCSRPWVLPEDELAFAVCLTADPTRKEPECCGRYPEAVGCDAMPAICQGFDYPTGELVPTDIYTQCNTYCGLVSPQPAWCVPAGATRAMRSPLPSKSPYPRRTPTAVLVEGDTALESSSQAVLLNGSGWIKPVVPDTVLDLLDVTISAGHAIVAQDLRVGSYLELDGPSALRAAPNQGIDLVNDSVDIVLVAEGKSLPVVDLGLIGEVYTKVPKVISVIISYDPFETKEIGEFTQVIISGRTLSNCEGWKSLVKLSDPAHFEAVCADTAAPEGRLLAGGSSARSLIVKGIKQDDGPNVGLIVGVAIAVIVVVAAAGVGFFLWRKHDHASSGSVQSDPG
jgi:hypothetical protein